MKAQVFKIIHPHQLPQVISKEFTNNPDALSWLFNETKNDPLAIGYFAEVFSLAIAENNLIKIKFLNSRRDGLDLLSMWSVPEGYELHISWK